ncbi:MAG: homoserine dehydrogenase [Candidatus Omnitrophica bacterium]|nr:homoserine dehydrogenase [Candidatus Omnitrophota bacterium]
MQKTKSMSKINLGLVGYGTVGSGVAKFLSRRKSFFKNKFNTEFVIRTICDVRQLENVRGLGKARLTRKFHDILNDPKIDIVIELIGGLHPAKEIIMEALKQGKHVITANKAVIANSGKELFQLAKKQNRHLYFESSVGAGTPIIKMITEGLAGNKFKSIYGIINGTCNFILSEMTQNNFSFGQALAEAQRRGFAESNPTLDINGMDSVHKLAILAYLAFGKFIDVKDIYREGITHISHADIEHATSLGLTIKLLAITKKENDKIEVRVHPTLISQDHPLASIHSIYNAFYINTDPQGNVLLSGEGAGQMAAASGVISDLVNFVSRGDRATLPCNLYSEASGLKIRKIDQIKTKFYIRFMVTDKPGVLSVITGILGKHGIGINSVTQKAHNPTATVPVIMLTDFTSEKMLRLALNKIDKLPVVKSKPVAIRMEKLL